MNKELLMKKIEAAVDAAISARMYGKLEIEFVDGHATYIRKMEQEKLASEANRVARFK